ncbi:hypothetical protein [Thermomonospora umbrina]|uniref:Uncharacterized protein n=1 Tax=Thermomonospora umbrina TaxID=111806 RepID=A0A3D9T146_9ACTN|nr:hypothetical protein [Thermomonospora umbrina]REF00541.1 hypothetical protein DFJ69_6089 [Thermomonospora umbrina]
MNDDFAMRAALGLLCDYCVHDTPAVVFRQKRGFTMITPDAVLRFEDPWNACAACAQFVERRQIHLLLDRVMRLHPRHGEMNRPQKRLTRRMLKRMYMAMYDAGVEKPEPIAGPS